MRCENCLVCDLNENINCPHQIIKKFGLFRHPVPEHICYDPYPDPREGRGIQQHNKVSQNYHDKNLGSEIEPKKGSKKAQRLTRTHKKFRNKGNSRRNLGYVIGYISTVISQLQLPNSLFSRSIRLFKEATKEGHRLEATALACLSIASEEARVPVSSGELSKFGAEKKKISEVKRKIIREQDLDTAPLRAEDFINKICSELGVPEWSSEVRELISDMNTIGKNPEAVVGGAVWHVSKNNGHKVQRNEIAEVCHCTDVAIQNNAKRLS